jgi:hypothetical protein
MPGVRTYTPDIAEQLAWPLRQTAMRVHAGPDVEGSRRLLRVEEREPPERQAGRLHIVRLDHLDREGGSDCSGLGAGAGATAGGAVRSPLVPVRESERLVIALAPFAATDDRSDYAGVVAVGDEVVPGDHAVEPAVPAIGRIAWARRKRPGGMPRWRRNARLNAYSLE